MTTILTDCANNIVGKLINLTIAETRYICCFKCIVDDFEKEKKELEAKWRTVGKDVEDAKQRAEDIREDVTYWHGQAENLIKEDTKTKMACFWGWCPNCISRYSRGKELAEKAGDIRRLMGTNFDTVGRAPHLPGVEYHSSQGFIHFESRDLGHNQLLHALEDDNNYMTGLQGMGGTGKTTLAKEVGKKLHELKKFDHVIFTVVSNAPDIKKIQDSIAGPLGLSLKDKSEWERPKILWKRLTDGQKILLILDDVWERINFEEIGIPSSDNSKGCRVLLTTRDIRVCYSMGCPRPIQLGLLSEQDAWILFKKHAGISDNSSKKLQDKGHEISKECKGLPVAVAAIASTLKDRHLEEWDAALTALRNSTPMPDVDENLIEIYKCLRYSYDNMKNEKAKRLFLLCSVFPEDAELPTEILTRFGTGVGLFGEVEKYHEARRQVLVAKNKLIDSCLLLEADEGCMTMHDLVREVAQWIANKEIQAIMLSEKNRKALAEKEKNIRYLFCDDLQVGDMDVFPTWFDGTKLEILLVYIEANDSVEVPNAFFEKMTRLRVLLLSHNAWPMLALSLPLSVRSLTNIRSIVLKDWKLGDISILGTLRSLETLDLANCSISELPNKITELEKLRLLNLKECEIERNNPFEVIGRCLPLEELYFNDNRLSILDSVNEAEAIHQNKTFPKLQRYHLQKDEEMDESISKCVRLPHVDALISEAIFKYMVQRAEILWLEGIKGGWRNLIPDMIPIEDEGMNDLVKLGLESCSKVQCLIDTRHIYSRVLNVFSKLVTLELESMDNLEELCTGHLPFDFLNSLERLHIEHCEHLQSILFKSKLNLCNLKIMKLEGCPMLASLFQLSTARSLVRLEELRICRCEKLTNIITDEISEDKNREEIVDGDNDHKSYGSMFPKLKTLEIKSCHQLECILPVLFARDFPLLETITIVDCGKLEYIFGQYQHEDHDLRQEVKDVVLGSLKKIKLSSWSNFFHISPECYHPMSSSVKRLSSRDGSKAKQSDPYKRNIFPWSRICCYRHKYRRKLKCATSTKIPVVSKDGLTDYLISSTWNSECLYPVESAQCLSKQSQGLHILILRNIREIELTDLDKIKYLFILSTAQSMLLEILRIKKCHGLKHIVDIGDDRDGKNWGVVFPKLKELSVIDCDLLEYMFGQYPPDHQNHNEIHIHLPALEKLILRNQPNFVSICPKSCRMMWPTLKEFELNGCPLFTVTSISDFMVDLDTRQLDCTTKKGLQASSSECVRPFDTSKSLSRQSLILLNIRFMTLHYCPKMISLFTFSVASTMLVERLTIDECHGLKHIVTDMGNDKDRKNCGSIFSKLKKISVSNCDQLEYVCGPYHHEDHNHNHEIHFDLPSLEELTLLNLPNMINICSRNHGITCPSLKDFVMNTCPQVNINSISDLMVSLNSRQLVSTTIKDIREIEKRFLTLETLHVENSKVESIFRLNGLQIIGQQMSLGLQDLMLDNLPQMTYICVGSKNAFTLQNLKVLRIVGCGKLEVIFPGSILSCLPELERLEIRECKELKQIIEEDHEQNQKLSNPQPCFPKLAALVVNQCNKLKRFISVSRSNEFPNLEVLIINEASELKELIGCEQGKGDEIGKMKVELPKLKLIVFMKLPSLRQGIEFRTVRHRVVHNCPESTLTSTTTLEELQNKLSEMDQDLEINGLSWWDLLYMVNRSVGTTPDFVVGPEAQIASGSELPSSQVSTNQSMQANLAEYDQNDNGIVDDSPIASLNLTKSNEESGKEFVGKVPGSEIPAIATSPTDSELIERPSPSHLDIPLHELVDGQSMSEPCLRNQQKPLGETESTIEIPQCLKDTEDQSIQEGSKSEETVTETLSTDLETRNTSLGPLLAPLQKSIKRSVDEGTTSDNAKIVTLSTHSELASSLSDPSITSQRRSYPRSEIILSQTETYTDKESEGHPINTQEFGDDDLISLFQSVEEDSDGQIPTPSVSVVSGEHPATKDNLVAKVLASLEESLKMPLKDIASCEADSLRLLTALNFLSRLPLEDLTLSDGLKAIINSLHQEYLSILCSFKQAFATTNKFSMLEENEKSIKEELAQRNKAAITVISKISNAKKFMDEAQQKEAILKEQIVRLEKEIKDCEAGLSSLQEEKKKCVAETVGYKKEFENVRKDKSKMVEDQRKARQELFEVNYKWSALCSQFEHNRLAARNLS